MRNIIFVVLLFIGLNLNAQNLGLYFVGSTAVGEVTELENFSYGAIGALSFDLSKRISAGVDYGVIKDHVNDLSQFPIRLRADYWLGNILSLGMGFGPTLVDLDNQVSTHIGIEPGIGILFKNNSVDFHIRTVYEIPSTGGASQIKFHLGIRK